MLANKEYFGFEEYFVSNENRISLKDLVNKYLKYTNQNVELEWGGREYRKKEIMNPYSKGKILPGWLPTIKLKTGIVGLKKNKRK